MQNLSLEKVCNLSELQREKLTKAELLYALKHGSYDYTNAKRKVVELEETITRNATDERAACVIMAAFNGVELPRDDYRGAIDSRKLNILELVGLTVSRCSNIGRS